jgi:hypothetical protein
LTVNLQFHSKSFAELIFSLDLQPEKTQGAIAQLVEQRTENPCVRGSTPRGTTNKAVPKFGTAFFAGIRWSVFGIRWSVPFMITDY